MSDTSPVMPEPLDHHDDLPPDLADIGTALDALAAADAGAAPGGLVDRLHAASVAALSATPMDLREVESRVDQLAAVYAASAPAEMDGRIHAATAHELHTNAPALRLVGAGAAHASRPVVVTRRFRLPAGFALAAAVAVVAGVSFMTWSPRARAPFDGMPPGTDAAMDDAHVEAAVLAFDAIDAAVLGEDVDTLASEAQALSDMFSSDPAASIAEPGARSW